MPPEKPPLPTPESLRGCELGTFTHRSIVERLPEIGRRTLAENSFNPATVDKIKRLLSEIPDGPIRPLHRTSPENQDWEAYVTPYAGQDWLEPPWFLVEHYFYQRVLEASGYFEPGDGRGVDPFRIQKHRGLSAHIETIKELSRHFSGLLQSSGWSDETLAWLLTVDLWGNQADLSMWPEGKAAAAGSSDRSAQTLIDETENAVIFIRENGGLDARFDLLIDNAGFELAADLLLALFILEKDIAGHVVLHAKPHPTFVSDAMMGDVWHTAAFFAGLEDRVLAGIGLRLKSLLNSGRLALTTHPFWTSPLPGWQMPATLRDKLDKAALVISKGDAHFRRLLGDRHWPFDADLDAILAYWPSPLLILRTLKSEVAAGIPTSRLHMVQSADPDWLVNGEWGTIQFVADAR